MYVDSASDTKHPGEKIHLQGPHRMLTDQRFTFQFLVTNNVVQYEALVSGLKMATKAVLWWLFIHSDLQVVMGQVTRQLDCKDPTLLKYLKLDQSLQQQFKTLKTNKVPRDQNTRAAKQSKGRL